MSNLGVSFDTSLIQAPGAVNASIAGVPLRLNPNSVSLSYQVKMSQTQTVGGFVFQIYGVEWSDLVVQGQFGAGGWPAQIQFFNFLKSLVTTTVTDQMIQGSVGNSIEPDGSFRFLFPLLGYDFLVFLKSYQSVEGNSVELFNENVNPTWMLTFSIDNDNAGLDKVAMDAYINRLQQGVGYTPNQYNGPMNANGNTQGTIESFLTQYASGVNSLNNFFTGTSGTSPSDPTSSGTNSTTTTPVNTSGITDLPSWAKALLQTLGYPTSSSNVNFLASWGAMEGGNFHNTAKYNVINTTLTEPGSTSMNSVGVQAYTSWSQGLQATISTLQASFYTTILAALKAGDATEVNNSGGLASALHTWSGGGYSQINVTAYV